ncbi:MAG TPA: hypothetical protein ENH00_01900 [Actinobacteria bacterium]|nr:hypothetical protein [Actinomycetota bacterium]
MVLGKEPEGQVESRSRSSSRGDTDVPSKFPLIVDPLWLFSRSFGISVLSSLIVYRSWVVFVGTFVLGDSVVLAAGALASQGHWGLPSVFGWALLGTVISDTLWFSMSGRTLARIRRDPDRLVRFDQVVGKLDRWVGDHPHRGLLFVKLLYGTRLLSLVYMSVREVPTRRFVMFDAVGAMLWLGVLLPLGWVAGMQLEVLQRSVPRAEVVLLAVAVVGFAVKRGWSWMRRSEA